MWCTTIGRLIPHNKHKFDIEVVIYLSLSFLKPTIHGSEGEHCSYCTNSTFNARRKIAKYRILKACCTLSGLLSSSASKPGNEQREMLSTFGVVHADPDVAGFLKDVEFNKVNTDH